MHSTDNRATVETKEFSPNWSGEPDKWRHKVPDYRTDTDWEQARALYDVVPADRRIIADALWEEGFKERATRFALCNLIGRELGCKNGHRNRYLGIFSCGLRCCLQCGRKNMQKLYVKHLELEKLCGARDGYRIALVEITIFNRRAKWPEAWMLQQIGRELKGTLKSLFGKSYKQIGALFFEEFVPNSPDLRIRMLIWSPEFSVAEFRQSWEKTAPTVDSEVGFRYASDFCQGLSWVTQPMAVSADEVMDLSPKFLAEAEKATHGVRKLHTLGVFFNAITKKLMRDSVTPSSSADTHISVENKEESSEEEEFLPCPICGEPLHPIGGYELVSTLRARGLLDIESFTRGGTGRKRSRLN